MDAEKVAVVAVTHQVAIELPIPPNAVVQALALDGRASEVIAGRRVAISDNRASPPIGQRGSAIRGVQPLISVPRESVVAVVGVQLHEQGDLFQIIQTLDAICFRLGPRQSRQEHPGKDGDDGDDDQEFDKRECP